jgi:predicted O-methyltransferase YrrM
MDDTPTACPPALDWIRRETETLGFDLASQPKTGAVLAALVASKPGGRFLELGTGTGFATAWLLAGMDGASSLDTVDIDSEVVEVAKRYLSDDRRVSFHVMDGDAYLDGVSDQFDLVFADAWIGKFTQCDEVLALVRPGGFYVVDDLLPQSNWPPGHQHTVATLVADLERHGEFVQVALAWASGLRILVRRAAGE